MLHADFVIIGAGIVGLSVARELAGQYPTKKIVVLEKENQLGLHASGRNSGVLHSGIYYPEDSLKAKFCQEGARAMAAYCDEHALPINRIGKLIVSKNEQNVPVLNMLYQRALNNGARVDLIKAVDLPKIEPAIHAGGYDALFSPDTAVVDSKAILLHLYQSLLAKNITFYFNSFCTQVNTKQKKIRAGDTTIHYGHVFNTAGLYADKVAKVCELEDRYTMIPFKGLYYELAPISSIRVNHLIYPVPDMNVPFLGVHITKGINGKIYIGPTAIPVLGREHYTALQGINLGEAWGTFLKLGQQYLYNKQGFRRYAHQEIPRFMKSNFVSSAKALLPSLDKRDIVKSTKVGIRAQLLDTYKKELVMDFVVHYTAHETHVLNAVSPAFTSAFSFAKFIVDGSGRAEKAGVLSEN